MVSQSEVVWRMDESAGVKTELLRGDEGGLVRRSDIVQGEHPLSLGKSSVWNQFFQVILHLISRSLLSFS